MQYSCICKIVEHHQHELGRGQIEYPYIEILLPPGLCWWINSIDGSRQSSTTAFPTSPFTVLPWREQCNFGCVGFVTSSPASNSHWAVVGRSPSVSCHMPAPTASWASRCSCKVSFTIHSKLLYEFCRCRIRRTMIGRAKDVTIMSPPTTKMIISPSTLIEV